MKIFNNDMMTFKQFYLLALFGITFSIAVYLFILWWSNKEKSNQSLFYKQINQGLLFVIFAVLSWSIVAIYKIFDLKEFTLSYIINDNAATMLNGFNFGNLIIALNGILTFAGLYLISFLKK